jgi:hypothetical protein
MPRNKSFAALASVVLGAMIVATACSRWGGSSGSGTLAQAGFPAPAVTATAPKLEMEAMKVEAPKPAKVKKTERVVAPDEVEYGVEGVVGSNGEVEITSEGEYPTLTGGRIRISRRSRDVSPEVVAAAAESAPSGEKVTGGGAGRAPAESFPDPGIHIAVEGGYSSGWSAVSPPIASCCRDGVAAGVSAEIELDDTLSLMPGIRYAEKGGFTVLGTSQVNVELDYIELPLLLKARMSGSKFQPFFVIGPNLGLNVNARARSGATLQSLKSRITALDLSIDAGLGAELKLSPQWGMYLLNRYSVGLVDVDNSADSWRNRNLQIVFGLKYRIK